MKGLLVLAVLGALAVPGRAGQAGGRPAASPAESSGGLLDPSCLEALAALEHTDLAGILSFVPEKDVPSAFADFLVRNHSALRRYLGKLEKDLRGSRGISQWDHGVVAKALELYHSPLADTLEKPSTSIDRRLNSLALAPTLSLEEINSRRRR